MGEKLLQPTPVIFLAAAAEEEGGLIDWKAFHHTIQWISLIYFWFSLCIFMFNKVMDTFLYTIVFLITAVPEFFLAGSILLTIVAAKPSYLLFVPGFLLTKFSNPIIKHISQRAFKSLGTRPTGCGIRLGGKCTGCGNCPQKNTISKTYGMPSGHAASMGYSVVFVVLTLTKNRDQFKHANVSIALLVALAIFVGLQRVVTGCHSITQILVGYIIGGAWGTIFYMLASLIDSDTYPTLW